MPVSFVDLAQSCAPLVAHETLAGVVSLESRFKPFNIRINSGPSLERQPASKAEAIKIATALAVEHQDIQLGLAGIGLDDLRKLKLTISDAFDLCLNLKASATLLDSFYRRAVKAGADNARAERAMLQSFYGRGDPSVGSTVKYDRQVQREIQRLKPTIASLTVGDPQDGPASPDMIADVVAENSDKWGASNITAPSWDVFNSRRRQSSIFVFQNKHGEE
ncbi:lytic transglycosylase domain-containing protein [Ochrobactrum vermis]|uniref:Lytic transglycosylase domain-containing protein n=1 Tax=Ochrobactrum vermis TaxID=1827297 RepID=A0ABU8PHM9_9HYPH|nr:lytic transglycosylase domain-containing protein [Ochrobactrum vermis]PQZ25557.1 type IV secretion system protein VirB1 [Ochrobactrum vermis]